MFYKKYRNKNLILTLFFISVSSFIFSPFIIASAFLPETIHLIEGKEEVFDFNVPVTAAFNDTSVPFEINYLTKEEKPESSAVLTLNSANKMWNCYNESANIENRSAINLNEKFSVISDKVGETEVTLSVFGVLPVKKIVLTTIPDADVIPSGVAVGVRINTDGIMVLGTGSVDGTNEQAKNVLKAGDLIISANGLTIENKEELIEIIENSNGEQISLKVKRGGEIVDAPLVPVKSSDDGKYKLGVWVRDSTQGIGTITYINPESLKFGALGHGIMDVDTKKIMSIKNGVIMESTITSSKKGKKGSPGELLGNIDSANVLGKVTSNTPFGIYGYLDENKFSGEKMKIGLQNEVSIGDAFILSTIEGSEPRKYSVQIESINKFSNDNSKGMILKITDQRLINKTNGIIQGMSGSPIIQNDKLIGAITHVFVQDPTKGYGIFIENMLKEEHNI